MGDEDQLTALANRLRSLDTVGVKIATEALPGVLAAARATADAGTSPDGTAWKPRKKDGGRPLANAASAISAVVSGTTKAVITLVLRGVNVYQHHGTGRIPARPILPTAKTGVPEEITSAVREVARRVIAKTIGGRS